jgi:16S rRNA (uracil1498-N3)-methyltransferase
MHRFFIPPEWLAGGNVTVSGPLVHQIRRVLRLRSGEHVIFLDNSGWEAESELTAIDDQAVTATVCSKTLGVTEPRTKITLYQSMLKGDHFELVLQKCTEVGVVEIVPVLSERCIVGDVDKASERFKRWQRVITEAAEQSHRSKLPLLRPVALLANALENGSGRALTLMPWEEEHSATIRSVLTANTTTVAPPVTPVPKSRAKKDVAPTSHRPFAVSIFIGPEGGFTASEIAIARQYGAIPVTLGPRIFRADTAGLVAATIILHEFGDMG